MMMRPTTNFFIENRGMLSRTMLLCVFILALAVPSSSQKKMSLSFRPGISFPTIDPGNIDLRAGYGFDAAFSYALFPQLAAYAGWTYHQMSSAHSFAGDEIDFVESGYALGAQFVIPFREEYVFDYFLKAGLILNHIEIKDGSGEIRADSGYGPGFQVEAGFCFSLADNWHLLPGIKYQTISRNIDYESARHPVDLNYLSAGVSVLWTF